jgi:asparagine synthase (glutamine-hydrolysing)
MRVGFTVVRHPGEIVGSVSLPERNDRCALVTSARVGDSFALLLGHFYYQQDCRPPFSVSRVNEAALALAAYRRQGRAGLERLEGDFALALWDAESRQLIGLRDPLGGYPLFWIQTPNLLALSTSIYALCKLLPQCTLNEAYIAEFLMLQAARNEGSTEQCAYAQISRVLPGTMIIASVDTHEIKRYSSWDWLGQIHDPGTNDLGEIAEQYRTLLRAAVRERMRGCTLAHLSGGMDSTSIALLAEEILCTETGGGAPLHTVSLVYERLPQLAQERCYIESALSGKPAIVAHAIQADELLDFDMFADSPLHDEPYTALASFPARVPCATLAAEIGAHTILTGYGADEVHSLLPYFLADRVRKALRGKAGNMSAIWRDAARWAKVTGYSPWTILRLFGFHPLLARWVAGTRWADMLIKRDADWSIPSWIVPGFVRRHALRPCAGNSARHLYQQCQPVSLSVLLAAIMNRVGDVFRWSVAAPLGIEHVHPFLDTRLVSFGLGMQSRVVAQPGNMKPVLAEAMRDILPEVIRCRQGKRGCNETYYLGLARNVSHLEHLIWQTPLEGIIDQKQLIQHLRQGSLAAVPVRHLQHLNNLLALLIWLGQQGRWQQMTEAVVEVIRVPVTAPSLHA